MHGQGTVVTTIVFVSAFTAQAFGSLQRESEWRDKWFDTIRSKAFCQSSRKTKQFGAVVVQVFALGSLIRLATRGREVMT